LSESWTVRRIVTRKIAGFQPWLGAASEAQLAFRGAWKVSYTLTVGLKKWKAQKWPDLEGERG
jgi:hypothetical protein